jgi:hypothetical protein
MRLLALCESEQSDRDDRLRAKLAFKQIKYWLDANADDGFRRLKKLPEGTRYAGSFALLSEMCDLDADYPDLAFIFIDRLDITGGRVTASFGQSADKSKSFIFIGCLKGPGDSTYLNTRFSGTEKYFVHEFMHYLMRKRAPDTKPSTSKLNGNDWTDYHNDADETNAYYQEAAHGAVDFFRVVASHAPVRVDEFADMTVQELVAFIVPRFVNQDFLGDLTADNRRALFKRLARCVNETIKPMLERARVAAVV